jgi:hypothetical protein
VILCESEGREKADARRCSGIVGGPGGLGRVLRRRLTDDGGVRRDHGLLPQPRPCKRTSAPLITLLIAYCTTMHMFLFRFTTMHMFTRKFTNFFGGVLPPLARARRRRSRSRRGFWGSSGRDSGGPAEGQRRGDRARPPHQVSRSLQ